MTRDLAVLPAPDAAPPLPEGLPAFLKLIADPNRLRILSLLAHGERCVCDIETPLDLPQNLTSHHLAALKRAGLAHDRREGKWVYYSLDADALDHHLGVLCALLDTYGVRTPSQPCREDEGP
jgi:DNA-binding transcriptional ArsR family regulator